MYVPYLGSLANRPRAMEWCYFRKKTYGPMLLSQFLLVMVSVRRCRVVGFNAILCALGVPWEYPSE